MGKSFKGFSKALSLILAVAMVVTCVPTSAYAADLLPADESGDILITDDTLVEDESEALVDDASASEEKSSSLIDTQKAADILAPEENTAGEEEITRDTSTTPVSIAVTSGSAAMNALKVGAQLTDLVLTASVDGVEDETELAKVTWKVYTAYTDEEANNNVELAAGDVPAGLSFTADGNTFTISGKPEARLNATTYKVVAYYNEDASAPKNVEITIEGIEVNNSTTGNAVAFADTVAGYTVGTGAGKVNPMEITLTNTNAYVRVTDLSISLEKDADSSFEFVGTLPTSIDASSTASFKIAPKSGLLPVNATPYKDNIVIDAPGMKAEVKIEASITVKDDIAVTADKDTVKIDEDAKVIDLGTFKAGNNFDTITLTATSSGEEPWFSDAKAQLQEGMVVSAGGPTNTQTISGKVPLTAYTETPPSGSNPTIVFAEGITTYTYSEEIEVTDKKGNSKKYALKFSVEPVDYTVTVDGSEAEGTYDWAALSGYTAANKAVTFTVTNNSDSEIKVTAAGDNANNVIAGIAPDTETAIPAKGSQEFKVTPKDKDTLTAQDESYTENLKFIGAGGINKTVGLNFTVSAADDITITTPQNAAKEVVNPGPEETQQYTEITPAKVGEEYSFTFKATTADEETPIIWTLNGQAVTALSGAGFTLNRRTGILSGTPKEPNEGITFSLTAAQGTDKTDTRFFKLVIENAEKAFELKDADGNELNATKGLKLEAVTSTSVKEEHEITVVNNTDVEFDNLEAEITNVKYKENANDDNTSSITDGAKIPFAIDPAIVANTKVPAKGSQTFTITRKAIKGAFEAGIYTATVTVTSEANGDYTFPISLTISEAPEFNMESTMWGSAGPDGKYTVGARTGMNVSLQLKAKVADSDLTDGIYTITKGALPSGLSMTEAGLISGTPDKAGSYEATFKVTDPETQFSDEVTVICVVAGSQTVRLVNEESTNVVLTTEYGTDAAAYKFAGGIVGGSVAADNVLKVRVINQDTENDIEGLTIKLDDISNNNAKAHFELSKTSVDRLEKNGAYTGFELKPTGTTLPGTYVVKVTVGGDTVTPASFFATFTVNEKLEITAPGKTVTEGKVGSPYAGYTLPTTGVNGQSMSYTLTVDGDDENDTKLQKLGADLYAAGLLASDFSSAINDDHAATFTGFIAANPVLAGGTFTFNLNAKAAAAVDATVTGSYVKPEQTASIPVTIKLTTSTDAVVVKKTETNTTQSVKTIKLSNGDDVEDVVTGISFKSQPVGYADTSNDVVTFTNKTGSTVSATAKMEKGVDSPFSVTGTISSVTNNDTADLTIVFNAGKTVGEYTDNLIIESASFETITIPVSAVVEDVSYSIAVLKGDKEGTSFDLTPQKKGTTNASADTFTIKNTSNIATEISSVKEVKNAAGDEYGTGSSEDDQKKLSITNFTTVDVPRDGTTSFDAQLKPASCAVAGDYTTYVKVTYKTGTGARDYTEEVITLNYTIYDDLKEAEAAKDIYYTPELTNNAATINLDPVAEGYTELPKATVKVANGTKASDKNADSIFGLKATIGGDDVAKFVLSAENGVAYDSGNTKVDFTADDPATVSYYKIDSLAKGKDASFNVTLKSGLEMGTYTATLTIIGENINTSTYTIKATVTGGGVVEVEATTAGSEITESQATRIFNTLALFEVDNDPRVTKVGGSATDYKLNLNKADGSDKEDVEIIKITGTDPVNDPDKYKVTKLTNCDLNEGVYVLELDTDKTNATYSSITIKIMDTVTFNTDTNVMYWNSAATPADWAAFTGKTINVLNGTSIADNDEAIPTVKKDGSSLKGWKIDGIGADAYVTDSTKVTKDITLVSDWYAYTYQTTTVNTFAGKDAAENGKPVPGIEWKWNEDYTDATLTLTDIGTNPPEGAVEGSKQTFSKDNGVSITNPNEGAVASGCETEGKKVYKASVNVTSPSKTYTDTITVSMNAIGHNWLYDWATVEWSEDNSEAWVNRKCTNEPAQHGSEPAWETVSANKIEHSLVKEAGHTEEGKEMYTATFLNEAGEVLKEVVKEVAIPATGHTDYTVDFIRFNSETEAVISLVCPEHGDFWTGKVTLTLNAETNTYDGVVIVDGKEYKVSTSREWKFKDFVDWNYDNLTATAEFTSNNYQVPGTVEVKLTVAFRGKDTKQIKKYTATVNKDPDGKDITVEPGVKYVKADGSEATEEEYNSTHAWKFDSFKWADDYKTAKALFTCDDDADETKELDATVTSDIRGEGAKQITKYTATISVDPADDPVVVEPGVKYIDANGKETTEEAYNGTYTWEFKDFTWADNNETASANFIAKEASSETGAVKADVSKDTRGKDANAITKYTATISKDPAGNDYSKTEVKYVKADGSVATEEDFNKAHTWNFDGFKWSDDLTSATASFTCEEDHDTVSANVVMTDSTRGSGSNAITRYTATVSEDPDGNEDSQIESKYVKADGTEANAEDYNKAYTWEFKGFKWADNNESATASFTAKEDENEKEEVAAEVSKETRGKDANAITKYTATISKDPAGGDYSETVVKYVKADGSVATEEDFNKAHTWEYKGFTWAVDNKSATAKFVTAEDGVEANVEAKMTADTRGSGDKAVTMYTATVSADPDGKAYSASDVKYVKANGTEATAEDYQKAGENNFDGDEDGTFTAEFADGEEYVYTGAKIMPAIVVKNGEKVLMEGVDYKVTYKNNLNAADKAAAKAPLATISGMGDYTSKIELGFTITKARIDDAEVRVGGLTLEQGAKNIQPVVTYKGAVLKVNKDYTVAADGDSAIKITGTGNFEGERSESVVYVDKKALDKINVTWPKTAWVYDGNEFKFIDAADTVSDSVHEAQIKVTSKSGATLTDDQYIVSYSDNVNAGSCKVTVTAIGGTDDVKFTGSVSKTFKIAPAKNAVMTVTNADELTSTGTKFKANGATPFVQVSAKIADSDVELVYGKDYTVKYSGNKTAGTGTARISFLGNYKGAKAINQSFTINKANLSDAVVTVPTFVFNANKAAVKNYTAKPDNNLFVTVDGQQLKKSEYTFTVTSTALDFSSGDEAEVEYSIAPSAKAKSLEGDAITGTYKVVKSSALDISKAKIKVVDASGKAAKIGYTGTAIEFDPANEDRQGTIQVTVGSGKSAQTFTGEQVTDKFTVEYVNNINKGTAYIVITANDSAFAGSAVGKFAIKAHTFVKSGDVIK